KWVESPPWLPSLIDSSALLEQLFGRIREIPAWGTLLRDGRLTQERTVAPRRLSTPNLPENQEIRSAPCARWRSAEDQGCSVGDEGEEDVGGFDPAAAGRVVAGTGEVQDELAQ